MIDLEYSKQAQEDLLSIWDWISYGNPNSGDCEAADRVVDSIAKTCKNLQLFPEQTRTSQEGIYRTLAEDFPNYLILFEVKLELVTILRIFEASLGWERVLEEELQKKI